MPCIFVPRLLSSESGRRHTLRLLLMCLKALEEEFLVDWEGFSRNLLSLVNLYQWIWTWNLDKNLIMALLIIAVSTVQIFIQNVQNQIFKILKIYKYNMKFTRVACWINSKLSIRETKRPHPWYSYFVTTGSHYYGLFNEDP